MKGYFALGWVLALLAGSTLAAAADPPTIEADEVAFMGPSEGVGMDDATTLLSGGSRPHLEVTADLLRVHVFTLTQQCEGFAGTCYPAGSPTGAGNDVVQLTRARLTLVTPSGEFVLAAARDTHPADKDALAPTRAILQGPGQAALAPSEEDEVATPPAREARTAYAIPAGTFSYAAVSPAWEATGALELFLYNAKVLVKGLDKDGKSVERTYEAGETSQSRTAGMREQRLTWLVVQSPDAQAKAGGVASGLIGGASVRAHALASTTTVLTAAQGAAATTTRAYEANGEDLLLAGETWVQPLSADPETGRMTLIVQPSAGAAVAAPAGEPLSLGPLAGAGAAVAGTALLAGLAYYWPRLKFALTLLALPLYTRIEREEVLEHGKREEIFTLIREDPGIHAHEISSKTNIGWGTTVYHLKLLEEHGLVVSQRNGRYKRFFLAAGPRDAREAQSVLRNDTAAQLARYVLEHPGTTQKELCQAVGIQPSLASWHVQRLEAANLVKKVKEGRTVRYFSGPAWSALQAPGAAHASTAPALVEPTGGDT